MLEQQVFLSQGDHELFGVLHVPEHKTPSCAFVFCHPFAEEKLWAHRVYVSLARQMAERGIAVLRFDFTGYGDSEGQFANCTLTCQANDIAKAAKFVRTRIPSVSKLGLLGLRLGGTAALLAGPSIPEAELLVLWEPVLDGQRFAQEVLRTNLASQLANFGKVTVTREQLVDQLRSGRTVNIEGYELSLDVYEQIIGIDQDSFGDASFESGLVVQVSRSKEPKMALQEFSQDRGFEILATFEEPFWKEIRRCYEEAENLFEVTLPWIEANAH